MRPLLLLTAAASLLAVAACRKSSTSELFSYADAAKGPAVGRALAPRPADSTSKELQKIIYGLDAVNKFADIFTSNIFDLTPVGTVATLLSKSLGIVVSFMNLFNGGQSESAEMKYMREQFSEVHSKLDGISLQIGEVINLINWSTTKVAFAKYEQEILAASKMFDEYIESPPEGRETHKRQFLSFFESRRFAAFMLYNSVVETDFVINTNLAAAVTHYTKNHRRQVTSFLLAVTRLVLRGAQLQIAYERLVESEADANTVEAAWKARTDALTRKVKSVEDDVKSGFFAQMKADMLDISTTQQLLSNKDFSSYAYDYLTDKFDWRRWIALVFKADSHYAIGACQGQGKLFTKKHGRSFVVASSNPDTSQFTQREGDAILARAAAKNLKTYDPKDWYSEIVAQMGESAGCDAAALKAVVCWGCDVWYTSQASRRSYRKITSQKLPSGTYHFHTLLFG